MSGRYQIRLYDPSTGQQTAILDDFNSLYYYLRLDDTSTHTFSMDGGDPRVALFGWDTMFEVYRADQINSVPYQLEYGGFHRTNQFQTTDKGDNLFTSYGRSYMDLLHRREVLYYAGTPGDTKTGPADNVMKIYVAENAGALATVANGRFEDGTTSGLDVSPLTGLAPSWSGSASYKNLLDAVQTIAKAALVDFSVTRIGPQAFRFDTFYPRLGVDRTGLVGGAASPVVFAPRLSNMSTPFAVESHVDEANDIIVLGQGDDTNRVWRRVFDPVASTLSPWARVERTVDSRNSTTTDQLDAIGIGQLNSLRATQNISFTTLQTAGVVYGRDYFVGDLILARYKGLEVAKKVIGVEVTVSNGRESIRVHFDDEASVIV